MDVAVVVGRMDRRMASGGVSFVNCETAATVADERVVTDC